MSTETILQHATSNPPRHAGTGDEMTEKHPSVQIRRWFATAFFAVAFTWLIVSVAGAAERVVLGEYFTNKF